MDQTWDVVIVGGGGSGLACAVAAAQRGARVLLLEKRPQLGGTTGIAIGSLTASRTPLQRRAGIEDTPAEHDEDAAKFGPPEYQALNNTALRRYFLEQAGRTLQWLVELGLVFHGPSPEPPNRVPRMHNVVPNAKAYIATLLAHLLRLGGRVQCEADVQELITGGGRVVGVRYRHADKIAEAAARRGVVLAAGDYASAPDLIAKHRGEGFAVVEGINPFATGDGHRLAEQAGAALLNMQVTYGPELRFVPPPREPFTQLLPSHGWALRLTGWLLPWTPRWIIQRLIKRLLVTWQHPEDALLEDGAILLNQHGRRFCNELDSPAREIAVASQPEKKAYLLLDERLAQRYARWPHFISTAPEIAYAYVRDYLRLRPDVAAAGAKAGAAASVRGLPSDEVERTVGQCNRELAAGQPSAYGRSLPAPLEGGRWILLGPVKAYFTTTEGGAAVNQDMQVLSTAGEPVPGLFAVGQNGLGGMVLWGHGLHIAWAMTSGRLAGEHLAST